MLSKNFRTKILEWERRTFEKNQESRCLIPVQDVLCLFNCNCKAFEILRKIHFFPRITYPAKLPNKCKNRTNTFLDSKYLKDLSPFHSVLVIYCNTINSPKNLYSLRKHLLSPNFCESAIPGWVS